MPVAVVHPSLLRIRKDAIGLCDLFEFLLGGFLGAGVAVGMVLEGKPAVSAFYFLLGCASPYSQHVIVVSFMVQPMTSLERYNILSLVWSTRLSHLTPHQELRGLCLGAPQLLSRPRDAAGGASACIRAGALPGPPGRDDQVPLQS